MKIRNRMNDNLHVAYLMEANKMNKQVDVLISCFMLNRTFIQKWKFDVFINICVLLTVCVFVMFMYKKM